MTPLEWTRGRPRRWQASLLAISCVSKSRAEKSVPAIAERICNPLANGGDGQDATSFLRRIPEYALTNEHAISVTVKAVARLNGVLVSRENFLPSSECADQREQRRARQMEIRQ